MSNRGLSVTVYEINDGDYRMQETERPVCEGAWSWAPNIDTNFDAEYGGIVAGCRYDNVMVRYQGFITIPGEYGTPVDVTFSNVTDDGHLLIVDGAVVIDDPNFKPCSGQSGTITLKTGVTYPVESWFFEAGGGACNTLYWAFDDGPFSVVPGNAFSQTPPVPPTTTTVPMIVPEVPTTTEAPVATPPETTPPQATTTLAPPTTTTPGTTAVPATTTTAVPTTTTTVATTTTTVPPVVNPSAPLAEEIAKITDPAELEKLVDSVDLSEVDPAQAIALVTNAAFIELPNDKLAEVFDAIPVSDLTPEQEAALVATLTNAPDSVKQTFESSVDVYGSGLDEYVPTGSNVTVGARRSLVAVTTVLSTVAVGGAAPGSPGGPSNGNGNGAGDQNKAARREDEPEDEEAGGLEGPEERQKNTHTRNSIYHYGENNMKKFNPLGFIKKFMKETAALAFTFAGSAIMFVTLSGDTRRIAIIATVAAVLVHYVHVMLENDED